jgi:hypothetical protein
MYMIYRCGGCGNRVDAEHVDEAWRNLASVRLAGDRRVVMLRAEPRCVHDGIPYTMQRMPVTAANKEDETPEGKKALRRRAGI